MIRCGQCGRTNVSGSSSCTTCGASLSAIGRPPSSGPAAAQVGRGRTGTPTPGMGIRCPACQSPTPPGFQFCGTCGTPIQQRPGGGVGTGIRTGTGGPAPLPPQPSPTPAGSPAVRAQVVVLAPDGTTLQVARLTGPETTIGTSGDVRLSDPYVSPLHAKLLFRGNALFVVPEPTLNGVFALVKSDIELLPGSELRLGRQLLRFETFPSPPPSPEPIRGSSHPSYRYRFVQLLQGGIEGDVYPLRDGDSLVGRAAGEVSFPGDGYVSSRHAVVSVRDGRAFIRDIGSSNGTFVRLSGEARVEPGDLLLFGEQLLRIDSPQ